MFADIGTAVALHRAIKAIGGQPDAQSIGHCTDLTEKYKFDYSIDERMGTAVGRRGAMTITNEIPVRHPLPHPFF